MRAHKAIENINLSIVYCVYSIRSKNYMIRIFGGYSSGFLFSSKKN